MPLFAISATCLPTLHRSVRSKTNNPLGQSIHIRRDFLFAQFAERQIHSHHGYRAVFLCQFLHHTPFFASYRIALHAALQRIQHDVNQLVERHCSSLHSIPFIQSSLTVTTFVSSFKKRRDRAVFALWLREPIAHALYSRYSPEGDVWKR